MCNLHSRSTSTCICHNNITTIILMCIQLIVKALGLCTYIHYGTTHYNIVCILDNILYVAEVFAFNHVRSADKHMVTYSRFLYKYLACRRDWVGVYRPYMRYIKDNTIFIKYSTLRTWFILQYWYIMPYRICKVLILSIMMFLCNTNRQFICLWKRYCKFTFLCNLLNTWCYTFLKWMGIKINSIVLYYTIYVSYTVLLYITNYWDRMMVKLDMSYRYVLHVHQCSCKAIYRRGRGNYLSMFTDR